MHIFDLRTFRRKKTIVTADLMSKEIVSLQFSEDNQLLVALSGAPDWTLMIWNWSRAKLMCAAAISMSGSPLYRCMFSPLDASVVTVIGKDCVKFFRAGEKDLRPLQENNMPNNNCTAFCWMRNPDDHLLVGTDSGKIMLFRSGEYVTLLPCSPGPSFPITSLASIGGGFVAGSAPGTFFFFSYDESKDQALFDSQFKLINVVTATEFSGGAVQCLALCPKDERLCAVTSDGQVLLLPVVFMAAITAEHVKYAVSSFHGPKPITGMDVAVRKPLILTCSKDQTLRLWNFRNHEIELMKHFPEEMFSVALHPTGLHCAVGFTDKIRVYHILVDDLRLCMEVALKGCRECRFSPGGNVLAVANGNSVVVYDFYTGEKVADLRGHNSKVRSIFWMPSGFQLLSCGLDGAVYLWTLDGAKRTGEFVNKGVMYTSVVNTTNSVLVVGNDRSLRELSLPELAPSRVHDAGLVLTNISVSMAKSLLFASTFEYAKPGFVRAYLYPLSGDYDDYPVTNSQILRMRLTNDENFLIVVDEQGCLCIMELRGRQDRFQRTNASAYNDLLSVPDWSDEVLVTRAELEDCNTTVAELRTKVEELKLNNEYQLKLRDMNYTEKIKETTDKFVQELEIAKSRFETLHEVRVDYEHESVEKLKYMEEMHQNNVQNVETTFQAQIMEMVDKFQKLVKDRDAQIERLDTQRRQLVQTHERYVEELIGDFEHKLDDDRQARIQHEEEKEDQEKELVETQTQLEDDIDTEVDNMKRQYEDKLALSRETTLKYKGENGIMKKKSVLMQRDIEDQKEEMKALQLKEKELHEQIKLLEKEVSAHKKEIKTRDASIGEKEKRIYELKKKNQELDKFKFVLDFKIRELKQQIEPRQMEIMAMREKIKQMDEELEKFHKSNSSLDNLIGELRAKIDAMQADVKTKRMRGKQLENLISGCRGEVQAAMNHIQTPPALLAAVGQIVQLYGSMENVKPRVDPEVESEYNRHREFLQRSIQELKKALDASSMTHMATNNTIRMKNMDLINEINNQREMNRQMKISVQADIGRIRHLANGINARKKEMLKLGQQLAAAKEMPGMATDDIATQDNNSEFVEPLDLLDKNKLRIRLLRETLDALEGRLRPQGYGRAVSKEVLPPLEGGEALRLPPIGGLALPPVRAAVPNLEGFRGIEGDSLELPLSTRSNGPESGRRPSGMRTYATEYQESTFDP